MLTLEDEYDGVTINFGVFDKKHIKEAAREAFHSQAVHAYDGSYYLEYDQLWVTLITPNKLNTDQSGHKRIRLA